jgi:hypothetical protein
MWGRMLPGLAWCRFWTCAGFLLCHAAVMAQAMYWCCRPICSCSTCAHRQSATPALTSGMVVWIGCVRSSVCLQATGYGGTVSQTHNIEAKLKAREDNPNLSQDERAKQREVRGLMAWCVSSYGGRDLLHTRW